MKNSAILFFGFLFLFQSRQIRAEEQPDSLGVIILDVKKAIYRNHKDLGDILFTLPGVWVRDIGTVGQWSSFRILGSAENQTSLAVNGAILDDPWTGIPNLNLMPVGMIDSLVVYSSFNPFGRSDIGGLIHIIPKKLTSKRPYTKFIHRTAKEGFSELDISFGQRLSNRLNILSGVLIKKYGRLSQYEGQNVRINLSWLPYDNMEIKYLFFHNKYASEPLFSIAVPHDSTLLIDPYTKLHRADHILRINGIFGKTETSLNVHHSRMNYDLWNFYLSSTSFPGYSTSLRLKQNIRFKNLPMHWGIDTQNRQIHDIRGNAIAENIANAHIQGKYQWIKPLSSQFAFHFHRSSSQKWILLGKGQINWWIRKNLLLHTGYFEGIRTPTMGERFGMPLLMTPPVSYNEYFILNHNDRIIRNRTLKPEKSRTLEAGFQWQLIPRVNAAIRGYKRLTTDLIQLLPVDTTYQFQNSIKNHFTGFSSQFHFNLWYGFSASYVINYISAKDENKDNLLERPNFWSNGAIHWEQPFFHDDLLVHLCFSARQWSEFFSIWDATEENVEFYYHNPNILFDIKASLQILKYGMVTIAVDNLLDTQTSQVKHFQLPGRTLRIGYYWEVFD